MRDDVSRLVGIDGLVVTGVVVVGRQLEIEVELVTEVACCRWCGRASLAVKDRPVVRVRDLSIAGRVTFLRWRKRRYLCEACERTFTETHSALPSRQRVSARFRAHLFERYRGGGAHAEVAGDERTTRYQVYRAFEVAGDELVARRENRPPRRLSLDEAHHRRGRELATVVSDLDRRRVIEVLPGCQRKVIERWLSGLPGDVRAGIEVVSIDPSEAYRHAIWVALPEVGSCATDSISSVAPTPPWTLSVASVSATPERNVQRAPGAVVSTSAGAPSSTKPATGCSRRPSG